MADNSLPATATDIKLCAKCGAEKLGRNCKPCHATYMRDWNKRHPDAVKRAKAAGYLRNKETRRRYVEKITEETRDRYREVARKYYKKHKDRILAKKKTLLAEGKIPKSTAKVREWRKRNVEKTRERARNAYWRKRDVFANRAKGWRVRNPDKCAVHRATRRAHVLAAVGSHTADDVAKIRKSQRNCCAVCQQDLKDKGHVDHIKPLSKGGTNDQRNLQLLCKSCNSRKADIDPIEFMQRIGRLL